MHSLQSYPQLHEDAKVWDVRAKAIVYDLATANNSVTSTVWDADENSLYVASICGYVDHLGRHMDYRRAKLPKEKAARGEKIEDDDKEEDWMTKMKMKIVGDEDNERIVRRIITDMYLTLETTEFMDVNPQVVPFYGSAYIGGDGYW